MNIFSKGLAGVLVLLLAILTVSLAIAQGPTESEQTPQHNPGHSDRVHDH